MKFDENYFRTPNKKCFKEIKAPTFKEIIGSKPTILLAYLVKKEKSSLLFSLPPFPEQMNGGVLFNEKKK